jgi:hypothetical protein
MRFRYFNSKYTIIYNIYRSMSHFINMAKNCYIEYNKSGIERLKQAVKLIEFLENRKWMNDNTIHN